MDSVKEITRRQEKTILGILIFLCLVLASIVYVITPMIKTELTARVIDQKNVYEVSEDELKNKGEIYQELNFKCIENCSSGIKIINQKFIKGDISNEIPDQMIIEFSNPLDFNVECEIYENQQISKITINSKQENSISILSDKIKEIEFICNLNNIKQKFKI